VTGRGPRIRLLSFATTKTVNDTPIHNEEAKLFTSSYENFIQTTGIRDGASHCAKILTCFYDNLDVSDPTDPEVIIKIDVGNTFNSTDRDLTLEVLSGHVSGTMTVVSRQGMLFLHVITYLPYSDTSRSYVRVRRNSGTSIGTDRCT
jgi:hypothetical protein